MITSIIDQLTRDEGFRANPYIDTTGHSTVGIGHNLVSNPLPNQTYPMSLGDAQMLLLVDLARIIDHLNANLPWLVNLYATDNIRACVLENVAFNVGVAGLLQFHNTLHYMQIGDWFSASSALLSSLAAKQLPERYTRLSIQLHSGVWQ